MYGFPPPMIPNGSQWNCQRPSHNSAWRPFHGPRAFRPRSQGFNNFRPPMQDSGAEHWCETCDRGFPTEDLLHKHKQQHQKCNIDGCQFIAHPKVITKHIQMQHSSGLYKKIAKLSNPEEIEKWREERKKKYPTKTNIEKKEAEIKEKIERGEKMGLGKRGWYDKRENKDQNRGFRPGQGVKRGYNDSQPGSKIRRPNNRKPKKPNIIPATEDNRKLVPFTGIQSLEPDSDNEVDEILHCDDLIHDDDVGVVEKKTEVEKPIVCGALSSLMCEYDSSDDEVGEIEITRSNAKSSNKIGETKEIKNSINQGVKSKSWKEKGNLTLLDVNAKLANKPTTKNINTSSGIFAKDSIELKEIKLNKNQINHNITPEITNTLYKMNQPFETIGNNLTKQNTNENDDGNDSGPEEVKVLKNEASPNRLGSTIDNKTPMARKRGEPGKKPIFRKPKPKLPSTLIYKLLSKEMKQERNIVLQCIRHIRKNNYFDK